MQAKKINNRLFLRVCFFVISSILLVNCGKNTTTKWVYYNMTSCADGWGTYSNNEDLKNKVADYFSKKNIKIYDTEILADGIAQTCSDCTCTTGQRVKFKIKEKDLAVVKAEGFYE
jgi:hypothetical protein